MSELGFCYYQENGGDGDSLKAAALFSFSPSVLHFFKYRQLLVSPPGIKSFQRWNNRREHQHCDRGPGVSGWRAGEHPTAWRKLQLSEVFKIFSLGCPSYGLIIGHVLPQTRFRRENCVKIGGGIAWAWQRSENRQVSCPPVSEVNRFHSSRGCNSQEECLKWQQRLCSTFSAAATYADPSCFLWHPCQNSLKHVKTISGLNVCVWGRELKK